MSAAGMDEERERAKARYARFKTQLDPPLELCALGAEHEKEAALLIAQSFTGPLKLHCFAFGPL